MTKTLTLWRIVRIVVFTLAAVAIFAFPVFFKDAAAFIVGGVMIAFGIDDLLKLRLTRRDSHLFPNGLDSVVSIFFGLFMIVFLNKTATDTQHLIKVCTIWAVWSITQEIYELFDVYEYFKEAHLGIVSALESIAVIVLSAMLLIDPEKHVQAHIIILGIELILKFGFMEVYYFLASRRIRQIETTGGKEEEDA